MIAATLNFWILVLVLLAAGVLLWWALPRIKRACDALQREWDRVGEEVEVEEAQKTAAREEVAQLNRLGH